MKVQIRSSQSSHNMAPWLVEKSQFTLEWLVRLYDDFRQKDDLPEDAMDNLTDWLSPVFYDVTKIVSFASGGEWSPEDRDAILKDGMAGLEQIFVKYGLLQETTEERRKRERKEQTETLLVQLKLLLTKPRDSASQINQLLFQKGFDSPIVNEMTNLTEKRFMGELTWEEYINFLTELVEQLEKEYNQSDSNNDH